jgi:hypothetical protein
MISRTINRVIGGISTALTAIVTAMVMIWVWSLALIIVSSLAIMVLTFMDECIMHSAR